MKKGVSTRLDFYMHTHRPRDTSHSNPQTPVFYMKDSVDKEKKLAVVKFNGSYFWIWALV